MFLYLAARDQLQPHPTHTKIEIYEVGMQTQRQNKCIDLCIQLKESFKSPLNVFKLFLFAFDISLKDH